MHSEKPAGMTLAEALGIQVPDNAPGGQPIPYTNVTSRRSSKTHTAAAEATYSGFSDYDAWNHPGGLT